VRAAISLVWHVARCRPTSDKNRSLSGWQPAQLHQYCSHAPAVCVQVPAVCQWCKPAALAPVSGQHSAAASDRHGADHAAAAGHNRVPEGAHSTTAVKVSHKLQREVANACMNSGMACIPPIGRVPRRQKHRTHVSTCAAPADGTRTCRNMMPSSPPMTECMSRCTPCSASSSML